MTTLERKTPSQIIENRGGIITELTSVTKMALNQKDFRFFANEEASAGIGLLAHYNQGGKNPIGASRGTILALSMSTTAADMGELDLVAKSGDLTKLINQAYFDVKKDREIKREGSLRSIHEPIPFILRTGAAIPVGGVQVIGGNLEHKNDKHALYKAIEIEGSGTALEFNVRSTFAVPASLVDHLLVMHLLCVEYPKAR